MNLRWAEVHLGDSRGEGAFVRLRGTVSVKSSSVRSGADGNDDGCWYAVSRD
jgi:hypothetical protein